MFAVAKLFVAGLAATTILSTPVANASAWMVDASHTRVGFAVRHFFTPVDGHFERFDVKLDWDRNDVSKSKIEAKIGVASVHTANAKRDAHLRTPDFFDAANFPEITFLSRSIRAVDATHFVASGDLTIRGVTKRVDLGYQGIETDYPDHAVVIPKKKPPKQDLTPAQKRQNRKKAKKRIVVEHTLAHLKQFQVLAQTYRNRRGKNNQSYNRKIKIVAGLVNLRYENRSA